MTRVSRIIEFRLFLDWIGRGLFLLHVVPVSYYWGYHAPVWERGLPVTTIRDVAKLSGVSASTVSRVLNKNGYVNQETEQKVKQAIQKLQYEPNAVARGWRVKRRERSP